MIIRTYTDGVLVRTDDTRTLDGEKERQRADMLAHARADLAAFAAPYDDTQSRYAARIAEIDACESIEAVEAVTW